MEKTTIFIYGQKNKESTQISKHRIVTFVNGDKDIIELIKEIIKDKII